MSKELVIAGRGILYSLNDIEKVNIGGEKVSFLRHHKENQPVYEGIATNLEEEFGVKVVVGKFGLKVVKDGEEYFYSITDGGEGYPLVAGENTVFSLYLQNKVRGYNEVIKSDYLRVKQVDRILNVIESGFILLPYEQEKKVQEIIHTTSKRKPMDWVKEFTEITEELGINKPICRMDKDKLEIKREDIKGRVHPVKKFSWRNDYDSVKELVEAMTLIWRGNKDIYLKPNNNVVRGGGMTIVNVTQSQKDYRKYVEKNVREALDLSKNVLSAYKIKHSNTTFSSYVTFTLLDGKDLKISIRDHSNIYEKGYVRFYIDAKNQEDFSKRLARTVDKLVKNR